MAAGACEVVPAVNGSWDRLQFLAQFVAVAARRSNVPSRQWELRFFVPGQGESGRPIAFQGMALLAPVEVRRSGELGIVFVGVTVGAVLEVDFKLRFATFGNVALVTLDLGVFGLQWVSGGCVLVEAELGWLEPIHGMTGGALSAVGSLGELPHVGILMAIHALVKREGLLEVASGMTLHALYPCVFALQRIFRSGVVEVLADAGR